jgi:sirohydrochlorin ferrochelatase
MKAILYIGHGTRSKKGAGEAIDFVERVMARIDIPIQEVSFLELTDPSITEGFARCVERGANEITIVPLFLLAAGHIKHDIPMVLASLQEKYQHIRIVVKDPFGVQESMLDGIAELVFNNTGDLKSQDRLLIVGRGSSDPAIMSEFRAIADGLKSRLGIDHISVCFLAAAEPTLDEGLEAIVQNAGSRVIVVPYLLFSGLLFAEINQKISRLKRRGLEIIHTTPLSSHQIIEDIVISRALM